MQRDCNTEYDFTLVLTGISELDEKTAEAFYTHGCDDATISVRSGRFYATFSRSAVSLQMAITSAIRDIRAASVGADVLRIDECNLVTQAEIARRSYRKRQQINQYIQGTRGPGGFPSPVCCLCEDHALWYWCEVSYWLWENNMVKEDVFRQAEEIELINSVLEFHRLKHEKPDRTQGVIESVEA